MSDKRKIERALISVSDKTGIVEFATVLAGFGVQIISTGGTAKSLRDHGIAVTEVSDITDFPEMMGGRVKTLHPKLHGALLGLRDDSGHVAAMNEHGIKPIDLVIVNLYPFEKTIAKKGVSLREAIENIDIGGPAMIRSASKNWRDVAVVTDVRLYDDIIAELNQNDGALKRETRRRLAALAFTRTASYDLAISTYLAEQLDDDDVEFYERFNPLKHLIIIETEEIFEEIFEESDNLPESDSVEIDKVMDLRYGENPHQKAAIYETNDEGGIAKSEQLQGKEMSFNNYVDADAAWNLVQDFDELAVAIIKHTNPSGVGTGASVLEAYNRALSTDPVSAFGGIVAFNRTVDGPTATAVNEVFTEVIIAPAYDAEALAQLRTKKNLRVLRHQKTEGESELEYKQISGGFLVQSRDLHRISESDLSFVTDRKPTADELRALLFAWKVCKHVKSNAIVFADATRTIGVGAGQMNRVDSVRIAAMRAQRFKLPLNKSVLASDAFFPFRDNVDEAASFGISAIIQPGGSVKDAETIAAANEHGIAMVFTGIRHFKH